MFCTIQRTGDNHLGNVGFRSSLNHNVLLSNGALNIVVNDWTPSSHITNRFPCPFERMKIKEDTTDLLCCYRIHTISKV